MDRTGRKEMKKKSSQKRRCCIFCDKPTRAKPSLEGDSVCKNCQDENSVYQNVLSAEATLDPGGPTAFALTGNESLLRRGYL